MFSLCLGVSGLAIGSHISSRPGGTGFRLTS